MLQSEWIGIEIYTYYFYSNFIRAYFPEKNISGNRNRLHKGMHSICMNGCEF
jgi:hypothetical protein